MRILIIGIKGFIGGYLATYCRKLGYEVWGADIIMDYAESRQYFVIDSSNTDYREPFESQQYDVCINCSGAASVPDSWVHPVRDFKLNVQNVVLMLEAIRTIQPDCKFLNLSSAAVYGNPSVLPISEDASIVPVSPYGVNKRMSEQVCNSYSQFYGLKTCSVRIFSAYGEGLKKQLFWDLYQKAKKSESVVLFGSGAESRDFIYIEDLAQAIVKVALHAKFYGQEINVGNGDEVTIKDCVGTFYQLFSRPIRYDFYGEVRKGDPVNWRADIGVLKGLGYRQNYSLKEGLRKYYAWLMREEQELG